MPNPITIKIDRKLVDRARVFIGKPRADGSIPEYYDFVLIPRKELGRFGETHMVVQACTKAERDAGLTIHTSTGLSGTFPSQGRSESP